MSRYAKTSLPDGTGSAMTALLSSIRYGVPAVLFVAGWIILFTADDDIRWDGWSLCLGAAGAILLLNVLFRYGAKGDEERATEEAARRYLAEHGHWPDEG
jgi:hypothetical protein